jgi:hypothetical protein
MFADNRSVWVITRELHFSALMWIKGVGAARRGSLCSPVMCMIKDVQVTYLEMRSPHELRPVRHNDPRFWIRKATVKQWQFNRFILLVGSQWSWTDRNVWTEAQWQEYAESDRLRTFVAFYDGSVAGYYELKVDIGKILRSRSWGYTQVRGERVWRRLANQRSGGIVALKSAAGLAAHLLAGSSGSLGELQGTWHDHLQS